MRTLRVLSEYSDAHAKCDQTVVDGQSHDFVEITFDDHPELFNFQLAMDELVVWQMFVAPEVLDVGRAVEADELGLLDFWSASVHSDGDLQLTRVMSPPSDALMEEEILNGLREALVLVEVFSWDSDLSMATEDEWGEGHDSDDGHEGWHEGEHGGGHGDALVGSDLLIPEKANETTEEAFYRESVNGCVLGVLGEMGDEEVPPGMDIRGFCECLADKFLDDPEALADMFSASSEKYAGLIESCMGELMPELEGMPLGDFAFDEGEMAATVRESFMDGCLPTAEALLLELGAPNPAAANAYCTCMFEGIRAQDELSFPDFEDMNSVLTTELDAACGHLLLAELGIEDEGYWNAPRSGCTGRLSTPVLISSVGEIKVKVRFGDVEKYLTLDSGCTEVIIDESLAKQLKLAHVIGPGAYLGFEPFVLADGEEVMVEKYVVSSMQVGECVQTDFVVGVMEEGGMLLGMGYLGLFDAWELDRTGKQLHTVAH